MTVLKAKIGGTFQNVLAGYASNVYTGPDAPTDPNIEFWVDTDDVLPVVPWIPVTTFLNNWQNYGSGFVPAKYRKVGDLVHVIGLVKNSTDVTTPIFNLPVGYRPPERILLLASCQQGATIGACRFDIWANGDVSPSSPGTTAGWATLYGFNVQFSVTA